MCHLVLVFLNNNQYLKIVSVVLIKKILKNLKK